MNRRQYLVGSIGGLSFLAGCTDNDDGESADGDAANTDTPSTRDARRLGELGQVSKQTATTPNELQFADRLVFETLDGEIIRTPADGNQYLLVYVELRVTDAPDGELVDRPDPFQYAAHIGGESFSAEPRRSFPDETNVIVEPVYGGYQTGSSRGTANSANHGYIAFDVPDDATEADVQLRYETEIDGDPLIWAPDAAREDE